MNNYSQTDNNASLTFKPWWSPPAVATAALWASMVIALLGTGGNILIICVFNRPAFARSSTALLLKWLATFDVIALVSWVIVYVAMNFGVAVNQVQYIVSMVLLLSSWQCSNWTLVVVTAERVTAVWLPHKAKSIWTRKRCKIVLRIIATAFFTMSLAAAFIIVLGMGDNEMFETSPQNSKFSQNSRQFWFIHFISSFLPGIPILCGNGMILWKLWRIRKVKMKVINKVKKQGYSRSNAPEVKSVYLVTLDDPSERSFRSHETTHGIEPSIMHPQNVITIDSLTSGVEQSLKGKTSDNLASGVEQSQTVRTSDHLESVFDQSQYVRTSDNLAPGEDDEGPNDVPSKVTAATVLPLTHDSTYEDAIESKSYQTIEPFSRRTTHDVDDGSNQAARGDDGPNTLDEDHLSELPPREALSNSAGKVREGTVKNGSRLNVILTMVCLIFFTTNMPPTFYSFYLKFFVSSSDNLDDYMSVYITLSCLMTLNSSLNFLCYSTSGSQFRNELKVMFASCCIQRMK